MDKIQEIASKNSLKVAEDSCQALGSKYKNQFAGTFGSFGALSFYPSKTLGCFVYGGSIVTSVSELISKLILFRDHGRGIVGVVTEW